MNEWEQTWERLRDNVTVVDADAEMLFINLLIGGALALYLRFLYSRFGASSSDADSITRVFPLLTIITTGVIAVVKSSLALSLGLVGALSIVRFRSAIKEPEELVYLFLCIAVGLALGADQQLLAILLVGTSSLFSIGMHWLGRPNRRRSRMMLTVTGDSEQFTAAADANVLSTLQKLAGRCDVHRLDLENGQGQVRVTLPRTNTDEVNQLVTKLKEKLPDCEFSYVNLESNL